MRSALRKTPPDRRAMRVLHVDDDASVLDLTSVFLDREIDAVTLSRETSPGDALDRLANEPFDCVISDYDMPGRNGLELFDAIRDVDPLVPFVLYTGKGSEEIASEAVNAGVTGYFQKGGPEQQRRLANRVEQAVDEYHTKIEADRYSTVLRALGYPIYVVNEEGYFSYVNDAFLELTGYDREEMIGGPTDLIKDDDTVSKADSQLRSVLSSNGPNTAQFDVEIVPKDGDPVPCRDHMAVLPYEGDQFRGSVGILRNICEEVRQRERIERRESELKRQNARLERFAGIVSHDLQSPISVATGRIELAKTDCDGDQHLDAALDALDRIETIVGDTLALAQQGETVGESEVVSLSSVVENCWRIADTGDATFEQVGDLDLHADPDRLQTLLENVFVNAVKHGSEDVTIGIGTVDDGFYIEDDGHGIPEDEREKVFDPGYTTAIDGTGFGLAIVSEIADAHGWIVEITDSDRGGARFEITGVTTE